MITYVIHKSNHI